MTGVIVDDEARSRRILKAFCEEYCPNLEIVGMTNSVQTTRDLLKEQTPDVLFLDIEMPHENGLALIKEWEGAFPSEVIFTTAYEQYALEAFHVDAIDYLLKPIQIDELIAAVGRVQARLNQQNNTTKLGVLKHLIETEKLDKIALTTFDGFTFVSPTAIVRCQAHDNYTYVYFTDGSFLLLTKTLKHYEEVVLNRKNFFRVHKSHLVNLDYVEQFIKGRQAYIVMKDESKIEVSERKRKLLLEKLEPQ